MICLLAVFMSEVFFCIDSYLQRDSFFFLFNNLSAELVVAAAEVVDHMWKSIWFGERCAWTLLVYVYRFNGLVRLVGLISIVQLTIHTCKCSF